MRGIKGPVGTQQDQLDLLGDPERVRVVEEEVASHLGFSRVMDSAAQVYPRSLDLDVVSTLVGLGSGPASFCTTLRLMAGADLATEGFAEGQVGSSAMPHKMNARSAERVDALLGILRGHLTMIAGLAGRQWNEGDVSCSALRRVAIPDSFFAADGLFATAHSVLDGFGVFDAVIDAELRRYLPFLSTTSLLTLAVSSGLGREEAHEVIKEAAVASALAMRNGASDCDMGDRLIADGRLGLDETVIRKTLSDPTGLTGLADQQTERVVSRISQLLDRHPAARDYQPTEVI